MSKATELIEKYKFYDNLHEPLRTELRERLRLDLEILLIDARLEGVKEVEKNLKLKLADSVERGE